MRASESFVHLFKGGGVQRQSLWPPAAAGGTPLCLLKRRRGSKGEPSPGVPPFLYVCTCAPIRWEVFVGLSCRSTPFLWCLPKETVSSRQRKALFYPGGSTIRVSASASVVFTHLRPTWGGGWWLTGRSSQLDAVGGDVGASSPWERRVGPNMSRGGTQARFFGAPPRFFAQEQRNGVERAVGGNDPHPRKRRTRRSVKKKGGNPWRGFPLSPPLLRFNKHKRVRPLRRAARGFASGLHRL